jgi:hypothetical protein
VRRSLRTICRRAGIGEEWTPRELRHTYVSLLPDNGMAIEEISRLMGHSSSNVTETVYRHQIRPVITVGPRRWTRSSATSIDLPRGSRTDSLWTLFEYQATPRDHGVSMCSATL